MKKILLALTALITHFFSNGQNVGIGITNPTRAKLELHGAAVTTTAIFGGDGEGISLHRNWPSVGFNMYYNGNHRFLADGYAAMQYVDQTNGGIVFDMFETGTANGIASTYKRILTLSANGNFGIGPNPHNSSLSVPKIVGVGISSASFKGTTHNSLINTYPNDFTYIRAGRDGGTVFINDIPGGKILMFGSVGVNTSTPVNPLEIRMSNGTNGLDGLTIVEPTYFTAWDITTSSIGVMYFACNSGTSGYFGTDGSYYSPSDLRIKKDIVPLSSTLANVLKLRPVSYEMIKDNPFHNRSIGLIAQELQTVFPQLVHKQKGTAKGYNAVDDLLTINYATLYPVVIKAIQEQQELIRSQEKEIRMLEQQCEALLNKANETNASK